MKGLKRALLAFIAGTILLGGGAFFLRKATLFFGGSDIFYLPLLQVEVVRQMLAAPPSPGVQLLILGDSTAAYSVDAAAFPDALSLAIVNSTSVEAYYAARKALAAGIAPRCLLVSFSLNWAKSSQHFWPMFVAGEFLGDSELDEIQSTLAGAVGDTPLGERLIFSWKRLLYQNQILDGISWSVIRDALFRGGNAQMRMERVRENMHRHRGSHPTVDQRFFDGRTSLVYEDEPDLSPQQSLYLRKLQELARERKIELFLLAVPFADSVDKEYAEGYWKKYFEIIDAKLAGSVPLIRRIQPASLPSSMYLGAGHLTKAGVAKIHPELIRETAGCFR